MTDNTRLNADDDLREKLDIRSRLGGLSIFKLGFGFDTYELIEFILADRKKHELEARLDETRLWYNDWGMSDETIGDGSWGDFYEYRIATLKQELENYE